jgi:hypothetical protein
LPCGITPPHREAGIDLFERSIGLQAFGGIIGEGHEIRMETLPKGMSATPMTGRRRRAVPAAAGKAKAAQNRQSRRAAGQSVPEARDLLAGLSRLAHEMAAGRRLVAELIQ